VAQRVGRGIALLFPDRGTRRGSAVSSTSRAKVTFRLKFSKKLRRYMLCCGVAACHRYGVCTVHCVECDSHSHSTQRTV